MKICTLRETSHNRVPSDTLYKTKSAFWLIDGNIRPKPAGRGGFTLHTPWLRTRGTEQDRHKLGQPRAVRYCSRIQDYGSTRRKRSDSVSYTILGSFDRRSRAKSPFARRTTGGCLHASAACFIKDKWIAVAPFADLEASLIQINYAQEHGAVGVLFRGMEHNRSLADPYFFPYQEASRLVGNLIHTGDRVRRPCPTCLTLVSAPGFGHISLLPVIGVQRSDHAEYRAFSRPALRLYRSIVVVGALLVRRRSISIGA